ncbi:integrase, catalytic region, zinc finger, CCHC-type containing protein [Tanacetum coccineum]
MLALYGQGKWEKRLKSDGGNYTKTKLRARNSFYEGYLIFDQFVAKPGVALVSQFEKLVNASRAKKLEKSHDPLTIVAHTGSSSRNTSSYYVTHPTYMVDYDDEYQQDDVQTNSEDPLASTMLRNSGNTGRNTRRAYVQEEVVEGSNAQNETGNVQRTLRTLSSGNNSTVQCYNCSGKENYARNCPKPRVRDSKYFMEQMLLAKQDEARVLIVLAGLGHNLFSVGQFCDGDLEVAFHSKTCYVRNLEGDDLLTGGRESNLYTISISDMAASSPVCLMSKATLTKSWLWHRQLSHLNFGTINDLTRLDLVDGLLKFKYGKDHLCSAYERGKSKKTSHLPKLVPGDHSKLELLHIDLCSPMKVASINGKKYILMIVNDYSRYTWVYFLHSKDETTKIIKKFIAQTQLNYKAKVCKIRTDNGTKFKNATLKLIMKS